MIDFWAESQAKWALRDYTEILLSDVLSKNTDFGSQPTALTLVSSYS